MRLLLGAVLVVALAEVVIEYIILYYNQIGISTRYVPLMMAFGNVIGAVSFWTLHSWENILDKHKPFLFALVTILFITSFLGGVAAAAAGILIYTRFVRLLQVQVESNIQHLSNEESRATISSIGAFGARFLAAGIVLLVGVFAVNESILQPLRIALVAGAIVFIVLQLGSRYRPTRQVKETAI